jgi:hypothetical protein
VEEDPGKDVEIKIRASIGFKKTTEDGVTLGVEAAIPKGFKFSAPEDCGSADLNYCDPTNTTLYFKGKKSKHWCNISFCK